MTKSPSTRKRTRARTKAKDPSLSAEAVKRVAALVPKLYEIVAELSKACEGRPFTLDGHLVGTIGEVLVANKYGLELLPPSTETHDAKNSAGKLIQIKATQGKKQVALSSQPDYLIVVQLRTDGTTTVVYDGPGAAPWSAVGPKQKNGQCPIALGTLRTLNKKVADEDRLTPRSAGVTGLAHAASKDPT